MTVGIFVDGENIRNMFKFDWREFKLWLAAGREIREAHYVNSCALDESRKLFYRHIRYCGFEIWRREPVYMPIQKKYKQAGVDVFLALKAMSLKDRFDTFILVSGDSDFLPLVELMEGCGKEIEIVSFRKRMSIEFKNYKVRVMEKFLEEFSNGTYQENI